MTLERKLQQISDLTEDRRMDDADRQQIEDELATLQRRTRRFRSGDEYMTYIEAQLGRALAIRQGDAEPQPKPTTDVTDWDSIDAIDAVDWSRVPLCGCSSPSCAIKKGDIPSACKDRSGGLLDDRSPDDRVKQYVQSHRQPHALRVAHQTWVEGYNHLLADAQELLSVARNKRPIRGSGNRSQEV
jgi:hypothetical protein